MGDGIWSRAIKQINHRPKHHPTTTTSFSLTQSHMLFVSFSTPSGTPSVLVPSLPLLLSSVPPSIALTALRSLRSLAFALLFVFVSFHAIPSPPDRSTPSVYFELSSIHFNLSLSVRPLYPLPVVFWLFLSRSEPSVILALALR